MSLNARFSADFSAFDKAIDDATIHVQTFEKGVKNASRDLSRMAEGFSGQRVIAEATRMVAVIEQIGGATKLTEAEQRRVNATLEEALEKYRVLGIEAPKAMTRLAEATQDLDASMGRFHVGVGQVTAATDGATTAFGTFHRGLSQADRTLAAMGVNIGPQVHALTELAAASGKTAAQIGVVATAGLVLATAIGAWKVGRAIADFFDLDEKIGNATAKLLGWGDAAAEAAGAKTDLLARASKSAGYEVTSLGEALRITKGHAEQFAQSARAAAAADAKLAAESEAARKRFVEQWEADVKRRSEARKARDKEEIAANAAKLAAMETADEKYRAHRNMIGELLMQEDLARMKAEEAAHAAHVAALMQQASLLIVGSGTAPSLSQRGTVTFGPNGEPITGGGSQFYPGSPVTVFGGEPSGASGGGAHGLIEHPSLTGAVSRLATGGGGSTVVNVNVDARDSFYDTPASVNKLADKVSTAVVRQMSGRGRTVLS